jgi:hypothetical protein
MHEKVVAPLHLFSSCATLVRADHAGERRHQFSLQRLQIFPVLPCKPPCFSLLRQRAASWS